MVAMTDENDGALFAGKLQRLEVHLGDERTSGVNYFQLAGLGFVADRRRNAVGAKNEHRTMGNFLDGFDKNRTAPAQLLHNIRVMDNLVVHVDRRAISFQRQLDDIDSAHNARAETSRPYPQQNFSIRCSWHCHPNELIPGDSIIPHGEPCPHPVSIRSPIFGRTLFPTFSMQICVESSGNWRRGIERRTHDEVSGKHGRHHENSSLHLCAVIPSNVAAKLEFFVTYANFPFGTTGALHPLPSHLIPFSSPGSGELNFSARRDWRTQTSPIL